MNDGGGWWCSGGDGGSSNCSGAYAYFGRELVFAGIF